MQPMRRQIIAMAGLAPFYSMASASTTDPLLAPKSDRFVLSDFSSEEPFVAPGTGWRGFTDRVMGGVSDAEFDQSEIDGRRCARMTGRVTRDNGGGFVQMALYFKPAYDVTTYKGIELLVYGNDEDYNAHIRTADCGWHDESYRATFRAEPRWQTVRLPWDSFAPNGLDKPLDRTSLQRLGLLGWMRDFQADLAIGAVALYS